MQEFNLRRFLERVSLPADLELRSITTTPGCEEHSCLIEAYFPIPGESANDPGCTYIFMVDWYPLMRTLRIQMHVPLSYSGDRSLDDVVDALAVGTNILLQELGHLVSRVTFYRDEDELMMLVGNSLAIPSNYFSAPHRAAFRTLAEHTLHRIFAESLIFREQITKYFSEDTAEFKPALH